MPTVQQIYDYLCTIAPLWLAEGYDNPGLLVGEPGCAIRTVLLSLDISAITAQEALARGAQLVVSHHPVIFDPLRAVLATGASAPVWALASRSVSAICMHTNLDAAPGGVNDALATAIGIPNAEPFGDYRTASYKKIAVFVPEAYAGQVRTAMTDAGAGRLGAYEGCAFEAKGTGYFRPLDGAEPFIGQPGKPERVNEVRLEMLCAPGFIKPVVAAMKAAHPYELPAYDIFDNEAVTERFGLGRIGEIAQPQTLADFAQAVKRSLSACCVRVADAGRQPARVAVCGGAADEEILEKAVGAGADTLVTGEVKHHLYALAQAAGLNLVEAGHFSTETVVLPALREKLREAFPDTEFAIADSNREPYVCI